MSTINDLPVSDIVARLFKFTPASSPVVGYATAKRLVGTRGQRYETREGYLERAVNEGAVLSVRTTTNGCITGWTIGGEFAPQETYDLYLGQDGRATREPKDAVIEAQREYFIPLQCQQAFLDSFEAERKAAKAAHEEARRKHEQGPAGAFERRLRAAMGLQPNDHMVTVYDRTSGNAGFSFNLYVSPEHAEVLVNAVEDHTDFFKESTS